MTDDIIEAAHQGKIVLAYRKLRKLTRGDLAELLGVDTSTIYRLEHKTLIKDIKKRQLLVSLLGIPAALMSIDKDSYPVKANLAINEDQMSFFEDELAIHWGLYYTGGTTRAYRGLDTWIKTIDTFAREHRDGEWSKRTSALLISSYQLQGSIYRDMMKYSEAHIACKQSFTVAKELDDKELMAAALARRGVTYIQQQKPKEAVTFLNEALRLNERLGLPSLKAYILQALSEAYAMLQQSAESWRSIALAERSLERKGTILERSDCQSSTTSTTAQKGVNAVLLHDNERAIALLERGLASYNPTLIRGRSRLVAQKAEAYYGLGDIEMCTMTATEAWTLARSVGSDKTCSRVRNLYASLKESNGKERSVLHLGVLLSGQQ